MGASELGWECCHTLFEMDQEIVGIFSVPREFRISWATAPVRNVRFRSFEDLASAHGVPLIYVNKKMSDPEYKEMLQQLRPDILVVIGWYHMVPGSLRRLAPLGAVGIHASLLPRYRGGAPLVWSIINGETQTGVSLFQLTDGVDDGDLVGQESFPIAMEDDIASVVEKATIASVHLVREYIPRLATGRAPCYAQDHAQATVMPQRQPQDGLIDWQVLSSLEAYNRVRAQTRPYPGAFTYLGGEKLIVWKAALCDAVNHAAQAGEILPMPLQMPEALGVWCHDGRLLAVQQIGLVSGGVMSGAEYAHLRALCTGAVLGNTGVP